MKNARLIFALFGILSPFLNIRESSASDLYSANYYSGIINRISPNGTISFFANVGDTLRNLAFDAAGNLYAADGSTKVFKITTNGTVSTFASGFNGSCGMAFDESGILFVASQYDNSIYKVTTNGAVSVFITGLNGPDNLAFNSTGDLFIANQYDGIISKITTNGSLSTFVSGFNNPGGLAFDGSDNLYVADQGNNGEVSVITTNGVVHTVATGVARAGLLAFNDSGTLFVSQDAQGAISQISTNGTVSIFATNADALTGIAFAPSPIPTPTPTPTPEYSQRIIFPPILSKKMFGTSFVLNAKASSGLPVSYSVLAGPATISGSTVTIVGVGMVALAADQVGDGTYSNAPQVIRIFNSSKAYQKIEKFAKISNTTIKSAPFTVTLPTSNSGLQVHIKVKGPASRSGNILTLSGKVGRVDLVATQLGNGNYHAASPVSTSFVVKAR